MHFIHGHLVANVLVFCSIIAWQGDIDKIYFSRLVSLQIPEESDLCYTYWTMPVIQHLKQDRE